MIVPIGKCAHEDCERDSLYRITSEKIEKTVCLCHIHTRDFKRDFHAKHGYGKNIDLWITSWTR